MLKEAFQVFMQELNESELSDEVSKLTKGRVRNQSNLIYSGISTEVTWKIDGLCWPSVHRQQDLHMGLITELGKLTNNGNRNDTSGGTTRSK